MDVVGVGGEDEDVVGKEDSFGDGVGDEEGGLGFVGVDGEEFFVEMLVCYFVECVKWFVEE